jgi:outer membrane protein insertion porin family
MTNLKLTLTGNTTFKLFLLLTIFTLIAPLPIQAKLRVKSITFEGNKFIKSSELKEIIKISEKKEFNSKLYRLDKIIITNYYLGKGFLNVWVDEEVERKGDNIDVIYKISEGRRFFFGGIKFIGSQIRTPEQLRSSITLQDGEPYIRNKIEDGLNQIENWYYNHGKPYIEIKEEQSISDSLIFLTINVKENETVYIRDIDYIGIQNVKSFIIRRELEIHKNDIYSRKEIERSQKNIYSTGLFDFVGMDLSAIDSIRSQVKLLIKVVEKKPRWVALRFGVAYEQEIIYGGTFDFTLEFGHRNLFGTARSISLDIIPSFSYDFRVNSFINPKNQYSLTYIEPWIGYTRTPGIFQVSYLQVRPLYSANYNYFTSSFQVKHSFENNWQASGTIAYNRVSILTSDTLSSEFYQQTKGQDFIYSLSTRLVQDKRDNYLNTRNGSVVETDIKFAYSRSRDNISKDINDNRFFKFMVQWNRYQSFPLKKSWVLASRIRVGNIVELGKELNIPLSERYYLGGASTVRGYREQLLGPVQYDDQGKNPIALGGKLMVLGNLELRIPLFWLFWGEVFMDAGNVWLRNQDFKFIDIKPSVGSGLAILTPVGPLRFDYGVKLRPQKYESRGEFHISISFAF